MKNKRKLELRYIDDNGNVSTASLTDTDGDGKPEVAVSMGDFKIGPIESPVAVPDLQGVVFQKAIDLFFGKK